MMDRRKFRWMVTTQRQEDGQHIETEYAAYWSPEKIGEPMGDGLVMSAEVAAACAIELTTQTGKHHAPLNAILLIEPEPVAA